MKMGQKKRLFLMTICLSFLLGLQNRDITVEAVTRYNCEEGIHQYEVVIKKAAEEDGDGERVYRCVLCEESYTELIPMYGHDYGEWTVEEEADCMKSGSRVRVCIRHAHEPEEKETEMIPASGHNYEERVTEAGCIIEGKIQYTCRECGDDYSEVIPPAGHQYGEWTVAEQPRQGKDGFRYRVCLVDSSHREEEMIEALPVSLNAADIVLGGANISVIFLFAYSIVQDCVVLRWNRRELRKLIKGRS